MPATSGLGSAPGAGTGPRRAPLAASAARASQTATAELVTPPATPAADAVIEPPPAAFDAPAAAPAPPPSLLAAAAHSPAGGVWAVVIGIDDYPGRGSDLRASVDDADAVDAALEAYGVPADRRLVLRDTQATAAVIADALRWLVERAGPDATAVVFYAGHVRKLAPGREAIVAADGELLSDVAMADLLRPLAAQHTWIAMASCYGAGFDEALAPNRVLTAAAGADSLAYENAAYRNSYLVEYMVERAMLQGRAPDSVEQAFAWAAAALRAEHPNRVPVQDDRVTGELALGTPPGRAVPPSPSPAPAPAPAPSPPEHEPPDDAGDDDQCLVRLGSLVNCDEQVSDH